MRRGSPLACGVMCFESSIFLRSTASVIWVRILVEIILDQRQSCSFPFTVPFLLSVFYFFLFFLFLAAHSSKRKKGTLLDIKQGMLSMQLLYTVMVLAQLFRRTSDEFSYCHDVTVQYACTMVTVVSCVSVCLSVTTSWNLYRFHTKTQQHTGA